MKTWVCALACLAAPAIAQASNDTQESLPLKPKQIGYAFDRPPVLAQQVLYGRAHGVALLAAACDADTEIGIETRNAYAKWHDAQIHAIAKMEHDLARWYFTNEAQNASAADIVRALNLAPRLEPNLSEQEITDACATFAQMLQGQRYDLAALLARFSREASTPTKTPDNVPVTAPVTSMQ